MRIIRLLSLALAGATLMALSACGGTSTGTMDIVVTGLPSGGTADVRVTGPGGYSDTVDSSTTLTGLTPGTYNVTGAMGRVPGDIVDTAYDASGGGTVAVTAGATAAATIDYALRPGSGKMWVSEDGLAVHGFAASQLVSSGSPTADVVLSNADGPNGLAFDSDGNLWVSLIGPSELVMYSPSQLTSSGSPTPDVVIGSDGTSIGSGYAIAFDADGNLWVANATEARLEMFAPAQLATSGSPAPSVALTAAATTLDGALGMTFDDEGALWVASTETPAVVKFPPSELSSSGTATASVILTPNGSSLARPEGLAFDEDGALWVANEDPAVSTLVKFTPAQIATSGSPVPDVTISDDGGSLVAPVALAFDNAGDLWVANYDPSDAPVVKYDAADLTTTGAPTPAVTLGGFTDMNVPVIAFDPPPAP